MVKSCLSVYVCVCLLTRVPQIIAATGPQSIAIAAVTEFFSELAAAQKSQLSRFELATEKFVQPPPPKEIRLSRISRLAAESLFSRPTT